MIFVLESDLVRDWRTFNGCVMGMSSQLRFSHAERVWGSPPWSYPMPKNNKVRASSSDSQMKGILNLPAGCLPNKTQGSNNPPTNISQMKSFNSLITILFDQIKIKINKKKGTAPHGFHTYHSALKWRRHSLTMMMRWRRRWRCPADGVIRLELN